MINFLLFQAHPQCGSDAYSLVSVNRTDSKVEYLKICPMVDGVVFHDGVVTFRYPLG